MQIWQQCRVHNIDVRKPNCRTRRKLLVRRRLDSESIGMANMWNRRFADLIAQSRQIPILYLALLCAIAFGGCSSRMDANLVVSYINEPQQIEYQYRITCLGDSAATEPVFDFVDPAVACAALSTKAISQRLINGIGLADEGCTLGREDGRATIRGILNGQTIDTVADREGGCAIQDWAELQDLLPHGRALRP